MAAVWSRALGCYPAVACASIGVKSAPLWPGSRAISIAGLLLLCGCCSVLASADTQKSPGGQPAPVPERRNIFYSLGWGGRVPYVRSAPQGGNTPKALEKEKEKKSVFYSVGWGGIPNPDGQPTEAPAALATGARHRQRGQKGGHPRQAGVGPTRALLTRTLLDRSMHQAKGKPRSTNDDKCKGTVYIDPRNSDWMAKVIQILKDCTEFGDIFA